MLLHVKQRPHPTPTLQGESCVNLIIWKTIGKTNKNKTTKEVKAKTINNHWGNQKNKIKKQTFGPMTLFGDLGPKVLFFVFFVFLVLPMVFNCFCFGLFGCFVFFWFSQWFLIFSTGFTGKPVRRRICLYIFPLLHPLFFKRRARS